MHIRCFTLFLCLLFPAVGFSDILSAPANMSFLSSNATNSTGNSALDVANAFDGILNSTTTNGAVFDLTATNPSTWTVDFINVFELDSLLLHQTVGATPDNGIQNFSINFYSGANGGGTLQHSQSFLATLNATTLPESFALSSSVITPGSMILSVTSSHGASTHAEFSEIQFVGTAVPEPGSIVCLLLAGLACVSRRRKSA